MKTREIPREEWTSFLDGFTRRHEMWRISVQLLTPDLGAQTQIDEMPLVGISADSKDGENAIAITAGESPTGQITHFVQDPNRVLLEQSDEGADRSIEIESGDGIKTLVSFRADVSPENLDK